MILYLIRHGRQNSTDCNVNTGLAEEGKKQAELLGKRMKHYPVDALYTSDLTRAIETAQIAFCDNKELLAKHQIRSGLREVDFGSLTGKEDAVVKAFYQDYYKEQMALFDEGKQRPSGTALDEVNQYVGEFFVPPHEMWYPDGENGKMVLERFMPVMQEWIASDYQHIAVVTHGGVIRILLCALFGGDFGKRLQFGTSLENCSITQLHYDEAKHSFFLDRFNDYAHIEAEPSLLRSHFLKPNE
ncbi:MAG: histidine phosphatase family protein [Butyribacter sp.]|nr:histidine phosphatase family protein [bacterium]MDY3853541.1 histidine phosphatase family protein [Butyribacter sp.]